jgi:hypothetical protein
MTNAQRWQWRCTPDAEPDAGTLPQAHVVQPVIDAID